MENLPEKIASLHCTINVLKQDNVITNNEIRDTLTDYLETLLAEMVKMSQKTKHK